jgi:two-component system OmpR family response regulator
MTGKPPCILVVEDDRVTRQIVVGFLKRGGYTNVVEAGLAEHAVSHLFHDRDLKIQLALVDLMLPNASGLTVIRKLRNAKTTWRKQLPVVVMTSRTDADTYKMAVRRGIQGYLLKPLSAALLIETVGKVLVAHGVRPPTPPTSLELSAPDSVKASDLPPTLDDAF